MSSHSFKHYYFMLWLIPLWIGSGSIVCDAQTMWGMVYEEELYQAEIELEKKVVELEKEGSSSGMANRLSHSADDSESKLADILERSSDRGWREKITATIFWVGEEACKANPVHNKSSSWDVEWMKNFGGVDKPYNRHGFEPKNFEPKMNPFYVALPYNDIAPKTHKHKAGVPNMIWWYGKEFKSKYLSVCKGKWIAIKYNGKICYAQWEDCGPFLTNDAEYVFNGKRPKTTKNGNAGIDLSPAIRDYLKLKSGEKVCWKFVEEAEIEPGPWSKWSKSRAFITANP